MINVLAREMEAELGDLFVNCQIGAATRMALIDMGHSQTPTPEVTDNSTGDGFFNDNSPQRRSRAIYMRSYWIRDRVKQEQFLVYWMAG